LSSSVIVSGLGLLLGSPAQAVTAENVIVGTYSVQSSSTAPINYTDPLSGSRATAQFSATPFCYGLACATGGPAVGAYGMAATTIQSIIDHQFSVSGPAPASVPLFVSGIFSNINPIIAGGNTESVLTARLGQGSTSASFLSNCYDFANPQNREASPAVNCRAGMFSFNFLASTIGVVSVELAAFVQPFGVDINPSLISAFIDPYIQIDPAWLSTHPGYSLTFDAGVSNVPTVSVSPVPEPETYALLIAGLGLLGVRGRFRKGLVTARK
jgi:hypothetical protein